MRIAQAAEEQVREASDLDGTGVATQSLPGALSGGVAGNKIPLHE